MFRQSAAIRGTEMDLSHIALGRKAQPIEAAYLVEWLLSPASSFITGTAQTIDGWLVMLGTVYNPKSVEHSW
jgi:hypothetical protein